MAHRAASIALAALAVALLAEIGARTTLPWVRGEDFAHARLLGRLHEVARVGAPTPTQEPQAGWWIRDDVLHPFVGFVRNPEVRADLFNQLRVDSRVNAWGFFGPPPIGEEDSRRARVAILGGSFATELFLYARDALREALARDPAFSGREIEIVCLALGGMKQPQQLLVLDYVLALGARFDLVLNVDGFNEVVLPLEDNQPLGVALHYPRSWPTYVSKGLDVSGQVLLGRIAELRERRAERAERVGGSLLGRSSLALVAWSALDRRDQARLAAVEQELREYFAGEGRSRGLQESGPPESFAGPDGARREAVELWRDGSIQLARTCTASGIAYLHVLQPNQYYPGERTFTPWEREHALSAPEHAYRRHAEAGYPLLVEAGRELAARGVPFADLTRIFDDERRTVYRDDCCHLNDYGYARLAEAIAAALAASR